MNRGRPGLKQNGGRWGDAVFKAIATAAGATIIGAIALMALFLIIKAVPSLQANHANFLTSTEFLTSDPDNLRFGIRDLFMVTVLSSVFARVIAVPVAIGIAAFLTNYVPTGLARPLGIDRRPAGSGTVHRLRVVGHLRAGSVAHAGGNLSERPSRLAVSVLPGQRVAWPAVERSSPRESCSR